MKPKVSVVMCTYNGAIYLQEQLDSLLRQDYPLHEIVVQDDGSTDGTWAILERYASAQPYIHLYKNEGKKGINGNFFSALKRATGELIAICDQDDIWETNKISAQVAALGDNWMCGGLSLSFSSDHFPVRTDSRMPCLDLLRLSYLSEIPGHVQLIRKELLDFLPEPDTCPYLYDWQLQFMAGAAEKIIYLDQVLVYFRRHPKAATATKPVLNRGSEGLRTFWFLLKNYGRLNAFAAQRFEYIHRFLEELRQKDPRFSTESTRRVQELATLYQIPGLWGFLKRVAFCMRHHTQIFQTMEPKRWKSILRSVYFPLYSLNYYRGIIESR